MTQLDLISYAPPIVDRDPKPGNARPDRFAVFHAANPHVFAEMLRLARAHLDRGATFISSKGLYEECRQSLRTQHGADYKLNNNYTADYSRALVEAEPRLVGVIELRTRRAR